MRRGASCAKRPGSKPQCSGRRLRTSSAFASNTPGRQFEQDEWHVLGRVVDSQIGTGRASDIEHASVAAHRWWSLAELADSRDLVYPRELTSVLGTLPDSGPPPEPWEFVDGA